MVDTKHGHCHHELGSVTKWLHGLFLGPVPKRVWGMGPELWDLLLMDKK